ncbi:RNA 2'-phosphotransferase [Dickeya phage vB_DsoM_JA29]|uniref:Putative RNA 2'-phosphotransferase n=1 Tax=Dickeya phage vB_DsoM_JA29 TaxID=2283031 RepID=A0A384ZXN6_9CAUD|nr:RNA 2'-phosphotransferase [Dickeya phage vB_DsoM_JA29]AXG66989.1 putative RNA 2'-phosphotransferase [Dickeya phage vB_DsoM_JA29]
MKGRSVGVTLTYFLRHNPAQIGLEMDSQGWVDARDLVNKCDKLIDMDQLISIVKNDEKRRFEFTDDFKKIRCAQGHSLDFVKIDYESLVPPDILYHGTNINNVNDILINGVRSMNRNLVHLSHDWVTAENVGSRKKAVCRVLYINARAMHDAGYKLYRSNNGVWLTDFVPPEFIRADKPA